MEQLESRIKDMEISLRETKDELKTSKATIVALTELLKANGKAEKLEREDQILQNLIGLRGDILELKKEINTANVDIGEVKREQEKGSRNTVSNLEHVMNSVNALRNQMSQVNAKCQLLDEVIIRCNYFQDMVGHIYTDTHGILPLVEKGLESTNQNEMLILNKVLELTDKMETTTTMPPTDRGQENEETSSVDSPPPSDASFRCFICRQVLIDDRQLMQSNEVSIKCSRCHHFNVYMRIPAGERCQLAVTRQGPPAYQVVCPSS